MFGGLKISGTQGARIGLNINVKKTKSPRLGISEVEEVILENKTIHQVGSVTYLGSINSKNCGYNEDVNSGIAMALGCFSQLKNNWKARYVCEPRLEY